MESDGEEEDQFRIETPRLVLRRPRMDDAEAIAVLADNWAVASNLARMPHPYRLADAHEWIEAIAASDEETAFAITPAATGEFIGACGVGPTTWTEGSQIGYWLGEPFWGRGYATEAARAMVELAFADPALGHLWCSCRVTNEGSRRVIHKCAFQYHGAGMLFMRAAGVAVPVEHYCLDREVWSALDRWRSDAQEGRKAVWCA